MAFREAGCLVEVVCPPGHPVALTQAAAIRYSFNGLRPLHSFSDAILAARPNLVVPCDDLAAILLSRLHRQSQENDEKELIKILELSIGDSATQATCCSRSRLMDLAAALGIRTATTGLVASNAALGKWLTNFGLPAVLKADGTSGGVGVSIVRTDHEAERAFRRLKSPPLFLRAAKRAMFDFDMNLVVPWLRRQHSSVSIQKFIEGREATSTIACWKGQVLAALSFEVLRSGEARGPAAVLRLIKSREMSRAGELLAQSLNLSGVYGFDFVLQSTTEHPYLIEMNARATQTSHLALGAGQDIPASLYGALAGEPAATRKPTTDRDVIVLFPAEWRNDPGSPFLASGYHDVPWSEPELVKDCVIHRRRRLMWRWPRGRNQTAAAADGSNQLVPTDDMVTAKHRMPDA